MGGIKELAITLLLQIGNRAAICTLATLTVEVNQPIF